MASLNKVFLMGNLTRDPEVRYTPKGTAVANLGMAVNRTYTAEGGDQKEEVTFVDIEVWGRQAETAGQYLSKGRPVFVEGRLRLDSWEDKASGQKRNKLKVVGERIQFLGSPRSSTEINERPPVEEPGEPSTGSRDTAAGEKLADDKPVASLGQEDNIPF